jgi:hypothetical protein
LAKRWGETVDHVTEDEARYFLKHPTDTSAKALLSDMERDEP